MTRKKAPEIRKEEIFDAALSCFNQKGYYETSIENIANKAGISKGGIYHHFSSKKELFIALFNTVANRYFESLQQTVHEDSDPAAELQDIVQKYDDVFYQNHDILKYCLEFIMLGTRDAEIRKEVSNFYRSRVNIFSKKLFEGIDTGTYKEVQVDGVARMLYFVSMGFFLTFFTIDNDFDPMAQHKINMQTVLDGIRKVKQSSDTWYKET